MPQTRSQTSGKTALQPPKATQLTKKAAAAAAAAAKPNPKDTELPARSAPTKKRAQGEAEKPARHEAKKPKPTRGTKETSQKASSKAAEQEDEEVEEARQPVGEDISNEESKTTTTSPSNPQITRLLETYGAVPLEQTKLADPQSPTPATILAHVLNAMLASARISHKIAAKSVACVIEAGYHNLDTLKASTFEQRTDVLTAGGYTQYRDKTATALGQLAEFVEEKYECFEFDNQYPIISIDSDLNTLLPKTASTPPKIRTALKEIKGLGDVGIDIFFDTAQGVWPCLAPFVDPRSRKTAEAIGLDGDVERMWEELGRDPMQMCRLSSALTTVRLEKKEKEFR